MKKKYTLLFLLCLLQLNLFAQSGISDPCIGQIYYAFSHKYDTSLQNSNRFKETALLRYGKNMSIYQSFDRMISEQKDAERKTEVLPNGTTLTSLSAFGSMDKYYFLSQRKEIQRIRSFGAPAQLYSMPDKNITINWKIESEIKQIGGFLCQKATTIFRGRNWTAWFCNDIPFGYGPWILNGLPGLILEAYDQNREVEFLFKEITKVTVDIVITVPQETVSVDEVKFEKIRQAFYESMFFSSGGAITASGSLNNSNISKSNVSNNFNNPIDLVSKAPRRPYWY